MAPKYALLSGALGKAHFVPDATVAGPPGIRGAGSMSHAIHANGSRQLAVGLTEMVSTARGEQQVKASREVSSQMTYCKPTGQFRPDGAGCVQRT
jgi:hypothetical protein